MSIIEELVAPTRVSMVVPARRKRRAEHIPKKDPCKICGLAALDHRVYHKPDGDPCQKCTLPAYSHRGNRPKRIRARAARKDERTYHAPKGNPCKKCGKPAKVHRVRVRVPVEGTDKTVTQYKSWGAVKAAAKKKKPAADHLIIGVDGEGKDMPDGRHVYTYLCAVDENGTIVADATNENGLSHEECTEMLLRLPKKALKFGYMFSYDVTMIIRDMPLADRFYLMRPSSRRARICKDKICGKRWTTPPRKCPDCGKSEYEERSEPVRYKGRAYDFFNGSFTIRGDFSRPDRKKPGKWLKNTKIWDCFRFFGTSFVEAIRDWQISTDTEWYPSDPTDPGSTKTTAQIDHILSMKLKRGEFASESMEDVKKYCQEECHLLALMMRKVIKAHRDAGIPLTRYEGAGSTASALLKKNGVGRFKGAKFAELAPDLQTAILSAFFGGRFENSTIGLVEQETHSFDISSAYPYAQTALPCLRCGEWRPVYGSQKKLLRVIKNADLAVARFHVKEVTTKERRKIAWGPLPFRDNKGSIAYGTNFYGWAWKPELLVALKGWPDLVELDGVAWVYKTTRHCRTRHTPFGYVPEMYRVRNAWGKEGPGKALKLGINAGYGKTAQSLGDDPPFQSWIWAGMTTSSTRAQLLEAILAAKDPWSVLAVATDGVYSIEELTLPAPTDTKTWDLTNLNGEPLLDKKGERVRKPLGGWEHKAVPEGLFLAKPGLYYRLKTKMSDMRARGVGRREVFENKEKLVDAFLAWDRKDLDHHIKLESRRFFGAKHSVFAQSRCKPCNTSWPGTVEQCCPKCGELGSDFGVFELRTEHCESCRKRLTKKIERERLMGDASMYGYEIDLRDSLCGQCAKPVYGQWEKRITEVHFDPHPKRERWMKKGGKCVRLYLRDLGGKTSAPYEKGKTTPEGEAMRISKAFAEEQPDWEESKEQT